MRSKKAPAVVKRQNRCWALKLNLKRCKRRGNWAILCNEHRSRGYIVSRTVSLVTLLASIVGLISWCGLSPNTSVSPNATIDVDVTLHEENRSFPASQYPNATIPLPLESTLKYVYERIDDTLRIKYELPYLALLSSGGPIQSFSRISINSKFTWQYPKLAFKVVNNTSRTVFLSEATIEVTGSQLNKEPIVIIDNRFQYEFGGEIHTQQLGSFHVVNEGWGKLVNASLTYQATTRGTTKCRFKGASGSIYLGTLSDRADVVIVPKEDEDECIKAGESFKYVDVTGSIQYETEDHHYQVLQFTTYVHLGSIRYQLGVVSVNAKYDVMLEVEKGRYVIRVPIAQEIKPGETDHFLLNIAGDKSARFDLRVSLRETNGISLPNKNVSLDLFKPHSEARRTLR